MSSSSVKSDNFFLVLLRDVPNAQRATHTPKHMEINIPLIESGYIIAGGGLLQKGTMTTDADAKEKMNGSCIIVRAESEARVWETLRADPFYTSGEVWDTATIDVTPIILGVPRLS